MRIRVLWLLAASLLLTSPALARSIVLERFDAEILVDRDGSLTISETLNLRFEGSWNGIVRSIPIEYRTTQGLNYSLLLDLVAVTDESGNRLRREVGRRAHYREFRIWIPGAEDTTRTVVLRYRVRNGLRFFDRHDELYWNVTGDEWEFPIESASAVVVLPEGARGVRANAFTGAYGSVERGEVAVHGSEIRVWSPRPLRFREGLTAVVAWDKGLVAEPGALERLGLFLRSNWPLGIPGVSFIVMFFLWRAQGRDPRRRPISVRYEPPEGLSPAEVGMLIDNSPDMRDLTATLVDLAVRGHIEIEEKSEPQLFGLWSSKDYVLRRRDAANGDGDLRAHERRLLDSVFRYGAAGVVMLSALENRFYVELPEIRSGIYEGLAARHFYRHRPDRVRRTWLIAAGVVGVGVAVGGQSVTSSLGIAPFTTVVAGLVTAAVIAGFGWLMPARTVAGTRALEEALGFQEFLGRVETDRFERLSRTPETFEKFLPFAMALGVESNWARAFDDVYRQPPRWYHGTDGRGFRCRGFVSDLGQMSSRAGSVLASSPRSSGGSGSGGGGFSGGGFGGGGGRGF